MTLPTRFLLLTTVCLSAALAPWRSARATLLSFPASIPHELLSETVPTAFSPTGDLEAADFAVEWLGPAVPGVQFTLGRESLQWSRLLEVLVMPRGRLRVTGEDVEGGSVSHAGFTQGFQLEGRHGMAEVPIALIGSEENTVTVTVRRGGRELGGKLRVRFNPRPSHTPSRVYIDPSCSRFGLSTESVGARPDEWTYIGCRLVVIHGAEHRSASLEMYVYWDGVGQTISVSGMPTKSTGLSVWPLRLAASSSPVKLQAGTHELTLRYGLPDHLYLGSLGVGIGPYENVFIDPYGTSANFAPLVTLYGSYFITEVFRVVAFDATSIGPHGTMDFGLYVDTENVRFIDQRLGINLMFGAHVIGFGYLDSYYVRPGFPQGFEVVYTDAFKPGCNLSLGAFLYPNIGGKAYYNTWLRWGGRVFAELNYISWEDVVNDQPLHNHMVGLSVGLPLAKFF